VPPPAPGLGPLPPRNSDFIRTLSHDVRPGRPQGPSGSGIPAGRSPHPHRAVVRSGRGGRPIRFGGDGERVPVRAAAAFAEAAEQPGVFHGEVQQPPDAAGLPDQALPRLAVPPGPHFAVQDHAVRVGHQVGKANDRGNRHRTHPSTRQVRLRIAAALRRRLRPTLRPRALAAAIPIPRATPLRRRRTVRPRRRLRRTPTPRGLPREDRTLAGPGA
jgi:hypothetical protein